MPELTILMPCLNEAATVGACVTKAHGFLRRAGIDGEVLVADNGSNDGSAELAAAAGARVTSVADRGYGAALRAGIQAAMGRYVIMGDADDSYDFNRLERFVEKLLALGLRTRGMEFATEMVVKTVLAGWHIAEVPATLAPDGRGRPAHLRSWRDGWRHLRFRLLFSPRWLFLYPGSALLVSGVALTAALYFAPLRIGGAGLDIHTMLYAAAGALLGLQLCLFALFARVSAQAAGLLPRQASLDRLLRLITLERGLLAGFGVGLIGLIWSAAAFWEWREAGFGALDPRAMMRETIPASALMIGGMEMALASFLRSVLRRKESH